MTTVLWRGRKWAALLGVLLMTATALQARAAEPASGALRKVGDSVEWAGPEQPELRVGDVVGIEPAEACPDAAPECDVFVLQVDAPAEPAEVTVTITSAPTEDYDLYVHGPNGKRLRESGNPNGIDETVTFPVLVAGRYEVRVNPFTTTPGSTYTGSATMAARTVPPDVVEENRQPAPGGPFSQLVGFATKTGFRGVFSWQARDAVAGVVHLGTSPDALDVDVTPPGPPDTAQLAIADGLEPGRKYYWQVEDQLTGETSGIGSFNAANAYTDWDGDQYTVNMLVQMQTTEGPDGAVPGDQSLADVAQGMSIVAERIHDATDGLVRLGDVIVTDTVTDFVTNVPFEPVPGCETRQGNLADVLVETTPPMDSHTFGGFAIDDPCTSFYVGRAGWLRIPSFPWRGDLDFGATSAHELSHYALAAPDLYPGSPGGDATGADCRNTAWDGSLMHNTTTWEGGRWWMTELDRSAETTPCTMGTSVYSWDAMSERYLHAGPAVAPEHQVDVLPRGNPDGGALRLHILDRTPDASTLEPFTPSDENTETLAGSCGPDVPVLVDSEGDSRLIAESSDPNLDLTAVSMRWDGAALTVVSTVTDLRADDDLPSTGSTGESIDVSFRLGTRDLYVRASRSIGQDPSYSLNLAGADPAGAEDETLAEDLDGAFDADANEVRVVVPAPALDGLVPGATLTDIGAIVWRTQGVLLLGQDTGSGACVFTLAAAGAGENARVEGTSLTQADPSQTRGGNLPRTGASLLGVGLLGVVLVALGRALRTNAQARLDDRG